MRAGLLFRALGGRDYRLYLLGSAVSLCGTWAQRVAQDLLVLRLGGDGLELGLLMAAQFLPFLVLGRWVGDIVDRVDRRRLLLLTQGAAALLAATLAILVATDSISIPVLILLAAALGVSSAFDNPARHTFVAEIVGDENYPSAQSLYSIVHNAGRLLGPGVAAATVAAFDLTGAFWLNAASFVAVIAMLLLIRVRRSAVPGGVAPPGSHRFRDIWRMPTVRGLLLGVAAVSLLGQNIRVVLPILVTFTWAGNPADYALLLGAMGCGALLGATLPALFASHRGVVTTGAAVLAALAAGGLAVSPEMIWAVPAMVVLGLANSAFNTGSRVGVLLSVPPDRRGSAMALYEMSFHGAIPIGAVALGLLTEVAGPRVALAAAAGIIAVAGVTIGKSSRLQ